MSREVEIIAILQKCVDDSGLASAKTVATLMLDWMEHTDTEDIAIDAATTMTNEIAEMAQRIIVCPDLWVTHGRFNRSTFEAHFFEDNPNYPDRLNIAEFFSDIIGQIDSTYQNAFRVENALQYLKEVAHYARNCQREIAYLGGEQ